MGKHGKTMPALTETFVPSAAVTAWRFVGVTGLNITTAGARAYGIAAPFDTTTSTDATNKKPVAVISLGIGALELNGTVSAGDPLMSTVDGRGVKWVPGAGNFKSAIAREDGVAGDRISVFVIPMADSGDGLTDGSGAVLAVAANAIAPTNKQHHVGAGLIKTITVPAGGLADGSLLRIIPDAAFTYDATGNVVLPTGGGTAVVNKLMIFAWDAVATKWTPSY
jgi:hypothetical protein